MRNIIPVLMLLAGLGLVSGCSKPRAGAGKVSAAATVFPLADLIKQVGGERVEVTCIVPPGASPHGFDVNPRARKAMAEAKLLVSAGITDIWLTPEMIDPGTRHICLGDLVAPGAAATAPHEEEADEHDEHGHHHAEDPHYWLNPDNMAVLAEAVGEALAQLDPPGAAEYRARAKQYAADCRALTQEMKSAAATFRHKAFIAEHPAYEVMAEVIGLQQVASIEPVAGTSGTPRHLQELVDQVIAQQIPAIYTEPQLPTQDAEAVRSAAAQRGYTVKVLTLDAAGNPSVPGRTTYLDNMRSNLAALKEGLE